MRIDPDNITNYNLDNRGLEEHLIFWILVAGKTAKQIVRVHESLIDMLTGYCPGKRIASCIQIIREDWLADFLKHHGCGCHTLKARALKSYARLSRDIDLRTCEPHELQLIFGVGPKTARCFILHSREGARYAGLDTHILRWLREEIKIADVPRSTPGSERKYRQIEKVFLYLADLTECTPAELDLDIWRAYRK